MNEHDRKIALHELRAPLGLTRLGMIAEQIVRGLWPLWSVLMVLFVILAFGLHSRVSVEVFWLGAVLFVLGIGYGLWYGARHTRWISAQDAVDRLDRSMPGRPLTATFDQMAIGTQDPAAQSVWQAHIKRTKEKLSQAQPVSPDLQIAKRDPYALRYTAAILFAVALLFGSILRLGAPQAILPGTPGQAIIAGPSWEAWVEPPAYTGKPTIYLNDVNDPSLEVPQGSGVTLRLYGQLGAITWAETLSGAPKPEEPQSALSFNVTQSGELTIEDRNWQISARADAPPKVWFQGTIERTLDGEMKLPFNASDDYGVEAGTTTITLDLEKIDRRYGLAVAPEPREPVILDLPMPISGKRDNFSDLLVENMAQHPWAGLEVRFTLDVTDATGQDSADEFVDSRLASKRFFQPIAAALIEQRRDLLWSRENAKRVSQVLRTISYQPDGFFPKETHHLRVKRIIRKLETLNAFGLTPAQRDEIAQMLWDVATALEEGRLADALARLEQAREALSQAMRDGATEEEISELMQELQDAMRQYMEQLANEQEQNGQQQPQGESREVTQSDLQEMLDRIEELMKEGRTAEAEQLLQELMEMMQNMQVTQSQQGQGQQGEGDQAMQGLQDTLRQQQGLSDEAFRDLQEQFNPNAQSGENQNNSGRNGGQGRGQDHDGEGGQGDNQQADGQNGEQGQNEQSQNERGQSQQGQGDQSGSLADRQERLRDELERQRNGRLPGEGTEAGDAAREALERADDAMGRAERALRDDRMADALGAQSDAMEALREGMRNLSDAIAENQQQGQPGQNEGQFAQNQGQDPLGRQQGQDGTIGTDENLLGDDEVQRRSRELLDEIRRRSGEQERPKVERDYLNRLLDQF